MAARGRRSRNFRFFSDPPSILGPRNQGCGRPIVVWVVPRDAADMEASKFRVQICTPPGFGSPEFFCKKVHFLGGKSFFFAPLRYAPGFGLWITDQYSVRAFRQKKPHVATTPNKGTYNRWPMHFGPIYKMPGAPVFTWQDCLLCRCAML